MAQTPPTPIPASPDAPDRADRNTFSPKATAWADWVKDDAVPGMNAIGQNAYDNAVDAGASALAASTSEGNAAASALLAQDHASGSVATGSAKEWATSSGVVDGGEKGAKGYAQDAAASAASALTAPGTSATSTTSLTIGTGTQNLTIQTGKAFSVGQAVTIALASDGTQAMSGAITAYNSGTGALTVVVDAAIGSGTHAAWIVSLGIRVVLGDMAYVNDAPADGDFYGRKDGGWGKFTMGAAPIDYVTRTSNTALAAADIGKYINITSGTFTQTFTAAATLGAGWWCYLRNSGTGDITLDPNSSELIDGLTSYVMYPGEIRLITCTGSAFVSMVLGGFYKVFTSSGTFVKPPGYSIFEGLLWGGGGNGGTTYGGGGGGACFPFRFPSGSLSPSNSVTIASSAGNSSFGSIIAYGGSSGGGNGGGVFPSGAPLKTANTLGLSNEGFGGGMGNNAGAGGASVFGGGGGSGSSGGGGGGDGGSSIYGGGGGGSSGGAGGTSVFGGKGGAGGGGVGTAPGGGGGGGVGGGAAGARGELRIWGII